MAIEMKDSGVEWIGEIPTDWINKRLKFLCSISTGSGDTQDKDPDGEYPFFVRSATPQKIDYFTHNELAILTAGDGDVGNIWHYVDGKFTAHQRVYIFNKFIKDINPRYLFHYFRGAFRLQPVLLEAKTTVASLRLPMLTEFPVVMPSISEQQKIADFLDKKTQMIDEIIADTKQSIVELKVYKQSIITEAVTKGLDSKVEMKDSGVEWIGEIPKKWNINKIKRLFEITKTIANSNDFEVLSITQEGLKIKDISTSGGQMASDYSKYQIVKKGYYAMNHMDLLTGGVDYSPYEGVTSPDYRVYKIAEPDFVNPYYFLYIFKILYLNKIFYGEGQGVSNLGRWRLQADKFNNFYIPTPTLKEQGVIVEFLDRKTSSINKLINEKKQLISEYEDYKKSLIYEYVTGKKQVK